MVGCLVGCLTDEVLDGYEIELAVGVLLHEFKFGDKELDPVLEDVDGDVIHFLLDPFDGLNVPLVASDIRVQSMVLLHFVKDLLKGHFDHVPFDRNPAFYQNPDVFLEDCPLAVIPGVGLEQERNIHVDEVPSVFYQRQERGAVGDGVVALV